MGHGCCCVFAIVRSLTSAGLMRRRLRKSIRSSFASRPSLELYETDRGYSNTGSCPYSLNVVEKEFCEDEMRRPTPCAVPLGSAKAIRALTPDRKEDRP